MTPRPATAPAHDHRFNHDILISEADQQTARDAFPDLFHILDFPELRDAFRTHEAAAGRAKHRSRHAGYAAISMGTTALLIAAFAPKLETLPFNLGKALALIAAALGVLSLVVGSRVVNRGAKKAWLCDRLMTERLRQLHFQLFARKLPTLRRALDSEAERDRFLAQRRAWLADFLLRFDGNSAAELAIALSDENSEELWLLPVPDPDPPDEDLPRYERLFAAYRALRFEHQIQYVSLKLDGAVNAPSEIERAKGFSNFLLLSIAAVLVIDMAVFVGVILSDWRQPPATSPLVAWAHMLTLAFAALILGARALEEGLQPGREVERYLQYRTAMRAARERFVTALTMAEKLSAMRAAEQIAYCEMQAFMKIHNDARFRI